MTILFLCGSLEPGKNGVGDYTRRLAGECIRQGHRAMMVALNERTLPKELEVDWLVASQQEDYGTPIPTWRWPNAISWNRRGRALVDIIQSEKPDVVSIQFVPYSFNPKGLPFAFIWTLRKLTSKVKVRWHLMFHELWLGEEVGASAKHRLIGTVQRILIRNLVGILPECTLSTSNSLYKRLLSDRGLRAQELPLFSNLRHEPSCYLPTDTARIAIFGHLESRDLGEEIIAHIKKLDIAGSITFVLVGNVGDLWRSIVSAAAVNFQETGFIDSGSISETFQQCRLGLASTNVYRVGKSGSAMAMVEHGLPVYVGSAGWTPRHHRNEENPLPVGLYPIKALESLCDLPHTTPQNRLADSAQQFLNQCR